RRALWTAKVLAGLSAQGGVGREEISIRQDAPVVRRQFQGVVLGIDPSLRGTGLALVEFTAHGPRLLASRTVKLKPGVPFAACLAEIFRAAQEFVNQAPVKHLAVEQTIFVQSRKTVHILGAAKGAAIAAGGLAGAEVFEYAPLRVKQAVVGLGRASKEQVAHMVAQLLGLKTALPADEADAAATALCHGFTWKG
ncbi:MAG TPA: crossover junction endodeoxyribonuclease RuvC, partial [Opitutales bacterium]|nr:crossover junction endodeoxyribonuclease RuvC [Opitutales bacterium]